MLLHVFLLFITLFLPSVKSNVRSSNSRVTSMLKRNILRGVSFFASSMLSKPCIASSNDVIDIEKVKTLDKELIIPLEWFDNVLCARFTIKDKEVRGIVDTGSPFITVPTVCTGLWGCLGTNIVNEINADVALPQLEDTVEVFGGQEYDTKWRRVGLKFTSNNSMNRNSMNSINSYEIYTLVAVVGKDILLPPGGNFLGLVKYNTKFIRPTWLGQTPFNSIRFDAPQQQLTLSSKSLIDRNRDDTVLKMVDLRPYGDSVEHYCVKVKRLIINGRLIHTSNAQDRMKLGWPANEMLVADNQEMYAVFDTGTTGCIIQDELFFDERFPQPPRSVEVVVESDFGQEVKLKAIASKNNLFVVTPSKIPWFNPETNNKRSKMKFDVDHPPPRVIVLGLSFLRDTVLNIDTETKYLSLNTKTNAEDV